jgi:DNA-binding CsgD family transcriptional regulator
MLSPVADRGDVVSRVERLCAGSLPAKALRERIIAELRPAVPFDAYLFALTDPVTRIGTSPLADVPGLAWSRLPELIRWRYLTRLNRWSDLLDAGTAAASLLRTTNDHPEQSLLWRHAQRDLGVADSLAAPFGDRYGCWGFLDLWRYSGRFLDPEVAFVGSLGSIIAAGLRRAASRTFDARDPNLLPVGAAVVVLGPDLQVNSQTAAAARALLTLNPPDEDIPPIPAAAYNIAAALVAVEQGVPVGPATSRVHLGGTRWVTVKADRMGSDIAVSIEPSTPAERMDLFARSFGLSARETEVLGLLGGGLDNREIAQRLVVSEHTATDHVKAILAKTGARTRQVLLARALGAAPPA